MKKKLKNQIQHFMRVYSKIMKEIGILQYYGLALDVKEIQAKD